MKKIILVLVLLLALTSCQSNYEFTYDAQATALILQDEKGERQTLENASLIQDIYDVLSQATLKEVDETIMMASLELQGSPVIYIDNKLIEIDGTTYMLTVEDYNRILNLISNYQNTDVVEVDLTDQDTTQDLSQYEKVGTLQSGEEIFYKPMDAYFERPRASEILSKTDQGIEVIASGSLSVPVMNTLRSHLAYVENVGFEMIGELYVYNGQKHLVSSDELVEKTADSRTIKDAEWYDDDTLFVIFGYDSGTVSQGGDVYFINSNDGDMRMVIDAKAGKEIVDVTYVEEQLTYKVVTWTDEGYQNYVYNEETIVLSDYMSQLPIRVEWLEKNLDLPYLTKDEIIGLEAFNDQLRPEDMSLMEVETDGHVTTYINQQTRYDFTSMKESIWRIRTSDSKITLPRGLHVGDTLDRVLAQFPQEKDYRLTSEGVFYGDYKKDILVQSYLGTLQEQDEQIILTFVAEDIDTVMEFVFNDKILIEIRVNFYLAD